MYKFAYFLSACLLVGCYSSNPSDLAKEFCECMSENTDNQECLEMAKAHKEALSDQSDKLQKYADEVLNCTNVSEQ